MFENIPLTFYEAPHRLSSVRATAAELDDEKYGRGNLPNASYSILGSTRSFSFPPISTQAVEQLNYVQAFTVFRYIAPSYTRRQNYPSWLIAYTYSGNAFLEYEGKRYALSPGDGFFIDCRNPHFYEVKTGIWEVAILHFDGPLCAPIHRQLMAGGSPVFHEAATGMCQQYIEQMLRFYCTPHLYRDWQASSCLDALMTHILSLSAAGDSTEVPTNMQYLIRYMESNFRSPLSMDDLGAFAGLNKHYLSREFRKYTGFSPNDYLIALRINEAKKLLQTTNRSAADIAYEVGIPDVNNFTRLFKKRTGMTPGNYRKST